MSRIDQVAREIGASLPRRRLLGGLVAFLLGWLLSPWRRQETAEAAGRRTRRKSRRRRSQSHRQRQRQRRQQRRRRRKPRPGCPPGEPCGEPGQICQPDGSCACTATSCPECQLCDAASSHCQPDPGAVGEPCGEPIQVCQPDGACACPSSGSACGGVCGCANGFICDEGECQPCDVGATSDSIANGAALQNRLDLGGTVRVCPGRYQHTFTLGASVTLIGAGDGDNAAFSTILDAGGNGPTLLVNATVTASLRGVRITGGDAALGGGVRNDGGLTLTACTLSGNTANLGGAIYYAFLATGSLALHDCQLTDNNANRGAGLDNNGIAPVTITGCTCTKNRSAQDGGGIYNNGGVLNITGSTFIENEAQGSGGGLYNATPVMGNPGEVTFDAASRVEHNRAGVAGGGIFNGGEITLNGATVTDNDPDNCAGDPVAGCDEEP